VQHMPSSQRGDRGFAQHSPPAGLAAPDLKRGP